ncbi:hypothetical protein SAMN05216360_106275 [Methylobacterium phyllostachyos]|uniref:AsmA protein n=1 Tax=Methylobacterium phyllostachyos TaxID=582672 RepID=A0A1G9ZHC2_9HYPH|nr:hypothetical protein [Methylobacterium phyllostachyos]SDN20760.1 hypothetical protein SAMN05216360_106275 [Methylobacterium phyllostachyos]
MIDPKARFRLRSALAATCALALLGLAIAPASLAAQEGAVAVQDVTVTDVVLPLGGALLKAPKLTASGTRLSKDDLVAILRPDSAVPWSERLARLDAGSLTVPVLTSESSGPGDNHQTVTYRDVVARDVRAGRVGELTAAGATVSAVSGSNRGSGTYGQVRATDLDLAALSRLYTVPGDGKGPVQKVYGTIQVSDVTYADARGTTVKIASLNGRDLGGRQIPDGWNGAFAIVAAGFQEGNDRRAFAAAAADLIEATSLGNLEMLGLSVSDADPKGPFLFEIRRVAYASSGPEAGTRLEDLSLSRGALRTQIGRLTLLGTTLAPTVEALKAIAAEPAASAGLSDAEMRRLTPQIGQLTLNDLSIELPPEAAPERLPPRDGRIPGRNSEASRANGGKPADLKPADPKPVEPKSAASTSGGPLAVTVAPRPAQRIALREAMLSFGPLSDGVPSSSRLTLSGLSLPAGLVAGQPIVGALPAYGYRDLNLDVVADAAVDQKARDLSVKELMISGRDIGTVRLSGTLGGIGPELLSGTLPAATLLMFSGSAKSLDVTVENAGLFERFLAAQSKDLSLKPEELRKEYVTASLLGIPIILGNGAAAKGIGAAMGQFVMKPGTLELHAKAKDPAGIGFFDLGAARSPALVLDRLDVDAKAN